MGIFKRALTSIVRRKANSIILLLIVFILANVLLTTLSVTMSLKDTKESVLKQLAPAVTIDLDYEKFNGSMTTSEMPKLDKEMADELYGKTKDIVKSYDYTTWSSIAAPGLKNSELPKPEGGEFGYGTGDFGLEGTQNPASKYVNLDSAKLISGKGFSDSDIKNGEPKVLISKQFAETNNLEVGSRIKATKNVYDYFSEEIDQQTGMPKVAKAIEYELEVVGILEYDAIEEYIKVGSKEKDGNKIYENYYSASFEADRLIATNEFIAKLNAEDLNTLKELHPDEKFEGYDTNMVYPEFLLKDAKNLDEFISKAKEVYKGDNYKITTARDTYDQVAKPLTSMGDLLDLVFKVTVVASVVILTLVLCIFMYLRQKEMGIYLALGEKRGGIIAQLLLETLIIALVGATLAFITSYIFSNMLADATLNNLLNPNTDMEGGVMFGGAIGGNNLTPEQISEQYQGGFNMMTILIFYITMVLSIVVSQLATLLYLLRLNPKKILM